LITEDDDVLFNEYEPPDNRIDIPSEASAPKPWYPTRPGKGVVAEIVDFIKRTGKPYLWPGHTHTKPPPGSKPVYLDEFELPKKFRAPDRRAPCPCCSPEHPKFCDGKIAWFPSEAVIRIIGPDCFKALDAEGHQEALDNLRAERQRDKNPSFLLSRLPNLWRVVGVGDRATRVADALEEFHRELHDKLRLARLDLWRDVQRGGELRISVKAREVRRSRSLEEYFLNTEVERVAYRLDGYEVLNPKMGFGTAALKSAIRKLRGYADLASHPVALDQMSDADRHEAATEIAHAITVVRRASDTLTNWQKFATPLAVNSLKNWGAHEGCPTPCNYELVGNRFNFGRSEYQSYSVLIPDDLSISIGSVDW
jgi:hypothetical protein